LFTFSCSNNDFDKDIEKNTLSISDCQNFLNTTNNVIENITPILEKAQTRTFSDGNENSLNSTDSIILAQEKEKLLCSSKEILYTLGFTDNEILEITGEQSDNEIITTALLCICVTHDKDILTKGITGNVYLDCALEALGIGMMDAIRTGISQGVSKAVAKQFLKNALKATCGSSVGIVITVGLWGLCVGGVI